MFLLDLLGDLLLGVRAARQFVQVLHLTEALGHTMGREPRLRVVVPTVLDGGADHLDALQEEHMDSQLLISCFHTNSFYPYLA